MVGNPPEIVTSNIGKWLELFGFINIPRWIHGTTFHIILWIFLIAGMSSLLFPVLKKFLLSSKIRIVKQKEVYNWHRFNSSLEELNKLIEQKILIIDSPINKNMNYKNIFERLIKEREIRFSINHAGYILLTKYQLPHNLLLQLLKTDCLNGKKIYYMRFIANSDNNPEFKRLLLNPKCKFSPYSSL